MNTIWISDWRVLKANWPERAPTYCLRIVLRATDVMSNGRRTRLYYTLQATIKRG